MLQLSNDTFHMHHNCHTLPSAFWVAHEGIIMTLKSTDMTKLLTGTRKIHCSMQPVPLLIQGCQPVC